MYVNLTAKEIKLLIKESVFIKTLRTAGCRTAAELLIVKAEDCFFECLELVIVLCFAEHIGCEMLSINAE